MKNDNLVVASSKDKTDCFAWISKGKCNALNSKDCKNCSFYRSKSEVPNYEKYISKKDLLERKNK
ncbi:MAG: hypothetical protein HFJ02_03650 [Bacilli bacterium]|jgi:hypothetical protein|nr:hypothetical protein [Bacilli bacterium]